MKIERQIYLDRLIARKHNGFVKIIITVGVIPFLLDKSILDA